MADLEDSLKKLDRLTQEEARIALSEVLKITHSTRDEVKVVDGKVEIVGDKVEVMGDKVADVGDKVDDVGDKLDDVGDKVHDVGDKVVDVGDRVEDLGDKVEDLGGKVHCVDEKVQVVIDGARHLSPQSLIPSEIYTFRRQASNSRGEGNKINRSTDGNCHRRSQVFVIP
jgi:methyl-accepting chemotaxis protein